MPKAARGMYKNGKNHVRQERMFRSSFPGGGDVPSVLSCPSRCVCKCHRHAKRRVMYELGEYVHDASRAEMSPHAANMGEEGRPVHIEARLFSPKRRRHMSRNVWKGKKKGHKMARIVVAEQWKGHCPNQSPHHQQNVSQQGRRRRGVSTGVPSWQKEMQAHGTPMPGTESNQECCSVVF